MHIWLHNALAGPLLESELPFEHVHAAYAHTLKLHEGTSTATWPLKSELMFTHFKPE